MDSLDVGLIAVLNGLAIGLLLFIVAVGLSLVFGMMDVLNLAHGAVFLLGAYVAWSIGGERPTWTSWLAALGVAGCHRVASTGGASGSKPDAARKQAEALALSAVKGAAEAQARAIPSLVRTGGAGRPRRLQPSDSVPVAGRGGGP